MLNSGVFCRSALHPRCGKNGIFDEAQLLHFSDVHRDGQFYALSIASRFLLRDEEGAHGYGHRTAAVANRGIRERTGEDPTPESRVHYLGFYDLDYVAVRKIDLEFYDAGFSRVPEHGEAAHFQIEWRLKARQGEALAKDKALRKDRSAARTKLSFLLRGPFKVASASCEVDNFELPTLPRTDAA